MKEGMLWAALQAHFWKLTTWEHPPSGRMSITAGESIPNVFFFFFFKSPNRKWKLWQMHVKPIGRDCIQYFDWYILYNILTSLSQLSFTNVAVNCIFSFCYVDSVTIIFNGWVIFYWLNVPTFISHSLFVWHLGCFLLMPLISSAERKVSMLHVQLLHILN